MRSQVRLAWGTVEYDWTSHRLEGTCRDGTEFSLPATPEQLRRWLGHDGEWVQDIFRELTADEREMLISGTSPAEFSLLFGEDGDDGWDGIHGGESG